MARADFSEAAFLENFEDDLYRLTVEWEGFYYCDSDSDSDEERCEINRMIPFYVNRSDVLHIFDDAKIYETFRFDKDSLEYLASLLETKLARKTARKRALSTTDQILIALQFFATGTFQFVVGNVLKVSQPTVSRVVHDVSLALCTLASDFITFPTDLQELKSNIYAIAGMPGSIGLIDCTHVQIMKPSPDVEKVYVNRKGKHTINVQAIVDGKGVFMSLSATKPGSVHDSRVFSESMIGRRFESGRGPNGYLIADSGYPCRTYMIPPFDVPTSQQQKRFNSAHKKTRCLIERDFGIWKRRFHCLHFELRLSPSRASRVILATGVLHNIAIQRNLPDFENEIDPLNEEIEEVERHMLPGGPGAREGFRMRDALANNHFS